MADDVLVMRGTSPTYALNIVRSWDPYITSIIILLPIILSLCVSVTWSIVATLHFKADAQVSTQTGFTIGSYVVTAGKLAQTIIYFLRITPVTRPSD